jgi:hypothetical protein
MGDGVEEMALGYFSGLSKRDKVRLMKRIVALLSEEERLELAKILLKK